GLTLRMASCIASLSQYGCVRLSTTSCRTPLLLIVAKLTQESFGTLLEPRTNRIALVDSIPCSNFLSPRLASSMTTGRFALQRVAAIGKRRRLGQRRQIAA